MDKIIKTPRIVMIPTPGIGHLNPIIELAKRILDIHPFKISFLIPSEGPPTHAQKSVLGALPKDRMDYEFLPPVGLNDLPPDTKMETKIALTLTRSVPAIRDHLKGIQAKCHDHLVALVVDLFGTDAFDVAWEFGMKPYLFFPSNALCLSFLVHLPKLDSQVTSAYKEMDGPLDLPGCVPLRAQDFIDPAHDRTNDSYKWLLHQAKRYKLAEGIMVNSFMELEGETVNALLQNNEPSFPPVYPVGPLIKKDGKDRVDGLECLTWLDDQPRDSVLFVSFGSGGTLSYDQLNELAYGLEMSDQRFLWVVRPPNNEIANASYFNAEGDRDPLHFLPKGFLDRIKGRGLVVPNWAPQVNILSHPSTGGFLTHCGWNSIQESVINGVPLIAWPLYAEQRMNAVMLSEGIKVALRPKVEENGIVGRDSITMVVKRLMESEDGKKIRTKMTELKDAAAKVVSVDGSSTKALMEVTLKWKSH